MVAVANLRLPSTWTTASPDNAAFDISANELDDDLEVIGDLDFGAFDLKATDMAATNWKANDGTASFSIANSTGILTMSANFNIAGNNIINTGTLTLPTSTDTLVGRATTDTLTNKSIDLTDNTLTGTSAELATAISDETGTGLLVFGTSPTIVTPTIASFTNAAHDHSDAAGGAQILSTAALSDTASIAYLDTANVYTAGVRQDFLGLLAGTAGLNVGAIAGNPTTQVNGDMWLNSTSNVLFARINGADVNLSAAGEVFTWTANHDANGFDLIDVGGIQINNPADTFQYIITPAAIVADRIVNLPILTGTDTLVFEAFAATLTNKTLTTPTIVATGFTNMQHTHQAANTGGTLLSTAALSDTANIAYLNTANTYTAGTKQDFLGLLAGTAGLNVGGIAGNPTTQVNGDVWYNSSSNTMFGRINGANVDLGGSGASLPVVDTTSIVEGSADATKEMRFEVDGLTTATTRVLTVPDADLTIVGTDTAQTLTSKTMDADLNTILDISDNEIKAAAAIAVNKLATLAVSRAVETDVSGFISASAVTATELGLLSGLTGPLRENRPAWTYLIEKSGANYIGWKNDGTKVSTNTALETVLNAVLDDKTETGKAIIEFTEGTFTFTALNINIRDDDLTIRGQGIGVTTLSIALSVGDVNASLFASIKSQTSTIRTLTAVTQGDSTVTATGFGGDFSTNDLVKVISADQNGNDAGNLNGELHRVKSVSGDVVTLYSVIEGDQWTTPEIGLLSSMNFNLHFEDFTVEDLRTSAPLMGLATFLRIRWFQNVTINNCRFVDCIRAVCGFDNCFDILITNCIIERVQSREISPGGNDIRYGVEFLACENASITACSFFDFRHAITAAPSAGANHNQGWASHLIFSGNFCQGTDSTAVDAHAGVRDYVIDGNVLTSNSISSDNGQIGIRGEDVVISNNVIKASAEGINIFSTSSRGKIVISGNEIESYERNINIQDTIGKLVITGNRLTLVDATAATKRANINIPKDSGNNTIISNNYIDGVDDVADGIIADSPVGMRITDNYFKDCLVAIDIADTDGDTDFLQIFGNTFVSCPTNVNVVGSNANGKMEVSVPISLPNATFVRWRNVADTQDLDLSVNASDDLIFRNNANVEFKVSGSGNTFSIEGNNLTNVGAFNDASVGAVRIGNAKFVNWRNNANNADIGLTVNSSDVLTLNGTFSMTEQADANADVAGDGQIWVNTATPNELFFTDDAGTDYQITPNWQSVYKTADETIQSDSTLTDDADLQFPVVANGIYFVIGFLKHASEATADFKYAFSFPAGTTDTDQYLSGVWSGISPSAFKDLSAITTLSTGGADAGVSFWGTVQVAGTAGTFAFQWAQATSQAQDTKVLIGSTLMFKKLN